ncbi:MAG: hypothetical protein JNM21_11395 [Taibaiella sp.]|nr:hypothetical protein [Taibaiella sp.]
MYKKKDDVSELVKALSNGEQRHFHHLYNIANKGERTANFWVLYESIRSGKSQLPNLEMDARAQTSGKRLLYENLLKSLRSLHDNASIDISIQNLLTNVELLYNHGLANQAKLMLHKAYTLALKYEKFGLHIQVLDWEKRLNIVLTQNTRTIEVLMEEERAVLEKMMQMKNLENIYSHILSLKRQYGYARGAVKNILDRETIHSSLMPEPAACLSKKAVYYYNLILAVYYWMTFEHDLAFQHSKQLTRTNECNVLPNDYISGLLQHITSSVCVIRFDEAIVTIEQCGQYISDNKLNQSLSFTHLMLTYHSIYKMIVYNYMGNLIKLREIVTETERLLQVHQQSLPFTNRQVILANLMNSYLGLNEMDKCENAWDQLFNKQSKTIRLDIYGDLYLFRLFLLLQDQNFSVFHSAAHSAFKFFKKHFDESHQFELELSLSNTLKKDLNLEKPKVLNITLLEIKSMLLKYIAKLKAPYGFQEHYTRYVIWADALMENKPYATIAQRWYGNVKK